MHAPYDGGVTQTKGTIMQNEGKEKGRDLYQKTHDGTTSAGSMGTGSTGHVGTKEGYDEAAHTGGMQSGGRTDDLLAGGSEAEQNDQGFASGERTGELQTGMGDMGSLTGGSRGNRQEGDAQPGGLGGSMRPSDPDGVTTDAGNMGSVNVPESGGQRIEDGRSGDLIGHGSGSSGSDRQNRQSGESGHGSSSGAGSTGADQRELYNDNPAAQGDQGGNRQR